MLNKFKKAIEAYNLSQFFGGKKIEDVPVHVGKDFNDKMDALGYGVKSLSTCGPCVECGKLTHRQVFSENFFMCQKCFDTLQKDIESQAKSVEEYEARKAKEDKAILEKHMYGDSRYNKPKEAPKASKELVEDTINNTEIYREAKKRILNAQHKQVAYGLDKYPRPLSADVWDIYETIDHIIDEHVDGLHYIVMLQIHLKRLLDGPKFIHTGGFDKLKKEEVLAAIEENWNTAEPGIIFADDQPFIVKDGEWIKVKKLTEHELKDEYKGCDISYDHDEGFTRIDGEPVDPDKHFIIKGEKWVEVGDKDPDWETYCKSDVESIQKCYEDVVKNANWGHSVANTTSSIGLTTEDFSKAAEKFAKSGPSAKHFVPSIGKSGLSFSYAGTDFDGDKVNMNFDDVPEFDPPKKKYTVSSDPLEPRKIKFEFDVEPDTNIDDVIRALGKAIRQESDKSE